MMHDHEKMIRHAMIIAKHLAAGGHVHLTHRKHYEDGGGGSDNAVSSPSEATTPTSPTSDIALPKYPNGMDANVMKGAPLDWAHLNLPQSFLQGFVPTKQQNTALPPSILGEHPHASTNPSFDPMSYAMPDQAALAQPPRTFARGGYADGGETDPMMDQDIGNVDFSRVAVVPNTRDGMTSAPRDFSYDPFPTTRARIEAARAAQNDTQVIPAEANYRPHQAYDPMRLAGAGEAQSRLAYDEARPRQTFSEMMPSGQDAQDAAMMAAAGFGSFVPETAHAIGMAKDVLSGKRPDFDAKTPYGYEEMVERAKRSGDISENPSAGAQIIGAGSQFLTDPANIASALKAGAGAKLAMAAIPGAKDVSAALKTAREVKPVGEAQRGILATPNLRQLSRDEAIEVARSEPHLIQDSTGQYVGAPRGVDSPEKIQAMREAFDKDVKLGAEGGDWYERARDFNREVAGDNPYRQSLTANEQALWSAQANPDTNQGFALNARTDYEAGVPKEKYRTGQQARNYIEARQALDEAKAGQATEGMMGHNQGPLMDVDLPVDSDVTGLARLGKKTGIYGQHLDPTVPPATTGTNDIWHARGFGYTNKDGSTFSRALSDQEHRFLDYETMLAVDRANAANLAGRNNWTGAEIQAAPWVAGKGRAMADRGNMTLEQGIAEASKTYPDTAPKYTMSTPIEQIPGASSGLLPNIIDADQATKEAFTNRANWKDAGGRDKLWDELNFDTRRTNDAQGAYRNSAGDLEFNPVEIGRPMTGFEYNAQGNPIVNPRAQAGFSMGQAARGLVDFQEGTPWNKFITHGAGPDKTSIHMNIGRNPTNAELQQLEELGQKHGLMLTNTEGGVGFINFKDGQTTTSVGKDLRSGLSDEIKKILPNADIKRARFNGDYFDLAEDGVRQIAKENQGQGLATKKLFDTLAELKSQAPNFYERILDSQSISDKAKANLDRLMEYGGKGQRPDYERLLKIVGEDKLRGLLDRVNKLGYQGLPVAAGAVGAQGVLSNSSSSKDQ